MRKTITDLKTRLQIAIEILKNKDYNAQVMTCGKCGSTYINKVMENQADAIHYKSHYVCENCGSYCIETQDWS